jgi:hypothetical protein
MDSKVDMTYRFLWDEEPSDDQLLTIMKEVGEDVCREHEEIKKIVIENIQRTLTELRAAKQTL